MNKIFSSIIRDIKKHSQVFDSAAILCMMISFTLCTTWVIQAIMGENENIEPFVVLPTIIAAVLPYLTSLASKYSFGFPLITFSPLDPNHENVPKDKVKLYPEIQLHNGESLDVKSSQIGNPKFTQAVYNQAFQLSSGKDLFLNSGTGHAMPKFTIDLESISLECLTNSDEGVFEQRTSFRFHDNVFCHEHTTVHRKISDSKKLLLYEKFQSDLKGHSKEKNHEVLMQKNY